MKINIISIICGLMATALPLTVTATVGETFTGYGTLKASSGTTSSVALTFQILDETQATVQVGNGNNACLSQYSVGALTVPATVVRYGRPYTVAKVADWAFRLCNKLTDVTFGDGLTTLGEFVFSGCSALKTVTLPKTITNIGSGALNGCDALTLLTVNSSTPPTLGYIDPFDRSNRNATLLVPYRSSTAYLAQSTRGMRVWYWWFNTVQEQPSPYAVGDINEDGAIDSVDAAIMSGLVLGNINAGSYPGKSDIDGDGTLTITDLNMLLSKVLAD